MAKNIQRVELLEHYDASIHCPFCGSKVINMSADGVTEQVCNPCDHTLFVATDEGFEYRVQRFDENVGIAGLTAEQVEGSSIGCDELTDRCTISDSVKFASYVGAPSGLGAYVGFAPLDE